MGELKWVENTHPKAYWRWTLRSAKETYAVAGLRQFGRDIWKMTYRVGEVYKDHMFPAGTTEEEAKALTLVMVRMGG